jgi:aminoglycoside 6'-N-acetyltransferase I
MKIRKMVESDKPKWLELRQALWPECPTARHALEMEQWQRSHGVVLLAEASGGQAVGFAEVSIRRDHVEGTTAEPVAYLEGWYVIPSHRREGVGRALIKSAEAWALESGFLELASDSEFHNYSAIRAHKDLGFREVGKSVHFVKTLGTPKVDSAPKRKRPSRKNAKPPRNF